MLPPSGRGVGRGSRGAPPRYPGSSAKGQKHGGNSPSGGLIAARLRGGSPGATVRAASAPPPQELAPAVARPFWQVCCLLWGRVFLVFW